MSRLKARVALAVFAALADLGESLPPWLFSREWNAFRLAVRGVDRPDERFRVEAEVAGAFVRIR